MEEKVFLTEIRTQIPAFGSQRLNAPALKDVDLSNVVAETPDGTRHKIGRVSGKPNYINITFKGQPPRNVVIVKFHTLPGDQKESVQSTEIKEIIPASVPPVELIKPPKGRKIPFFDKLQKKQNNRIALNQAKIAEIRDVDLSHPGLAGQIILTIDAVYSFARGLGMIQKAKQLQFQLKKPLYECYNRITGQGDGAIIAAAIAAGIDFDRLADWWVKDWKKVFAPGVLKKFQRWGVSKIKPYQSGYDAKQARAALRKLFQKTGADLRMKDVLTELQITVMQGDMKISTHYSQANPGIELWTAVEDSAVVKMHFNQTATIHGAAVFLGAIEKNDVMGLVLSRDNKNLQIHSIGAPVRVSPPAAGKLNKAGHAADKVALQNAGHFVYNERVTQLMTKFCEAGYKIVYRRFECGAIDHITHTDTSKAAMEAGIDSGSGKLKLLAEANYDQQAIS